MYLYKHFFFSTILGQYWHEYSFRTEDFRATNEGKYNALATCHRCLRVVTMTRNLLIVDT